MGRVKKFWVFRFTGVLGDHRRRLTGKHLAVLKEEPGVEILAEEWHNPVVNVEHGAFQSTCWDCVFLNEHDIFDCGWWLSKQWKPRRREL